MMNYFFEIHSGLPREGPGDHESTARALSMLRDLPANPHILDAGCGPGMQTLDLADLTEGRISAVDNHQPFLDQLRKRSEEKGCAERIQTVNSDMASLDFEPATFDLIWSEGAAYSIGFENALRYWKQFIKHGGYLAASELCWIADNPPAEVRKYFYEEYPAIQDVDANLDLITGADYQVLGHFILPESAWWDNYYIPIEKKLPAFRDKYTDVPEAIEVARLHELEIEMYRKYSDYYGYVFFIMQNL